MCPPENIHVYGHVAVFGFNLKTSTATVGADPRVRPVYIHVCNHVCGHVCGHVDVYGAGTFKWQLHKRLAFGKGKQACLCTLLIAAS